MKTKQKKVADKATVRDQIVRSAMASFRIEGIIISSEQALSTLKKVESSLEK